MAHDLSLPQALHFLVRNQREIASELERLEKKDLELDARLKGATVNAKERKLIRRWKHNVKMKIKQSSGELMATARDISWIEQQLAAGRGCMGDYIPILMSHAPASPYMMTPIAPMTPTTPMTSMTPMAPLTPSPHNSQGGTTPGTPISPIFYHPFPAYFPAPGYWDPTMSPSMGSHVGTPSGTPNEELGAAVHELEGTNEGTKKEDAMWRQDDTQGEEGDEEVWHSAEEDDVGTKEVEKQINPGSASDSENNTEIEAGMVVSVDEDEKVAGWLTAESLGDQVTARLAELQVAR